VTHDPDRYVSWCEHLWTGKKHGPIRTEKNMATKKVLKTVSPKTIAKLAAEAHAASQPKAPSIAEYIAAEPKKGRPAKMRISEMRDAVSFMLREVDVAMGEIAAQKKAATMNETRLRAIRYNLKRMLGDDS
jgi:hypothetical protein